MYRVPVIEAIRLTGATIKASGLYQRLSRHRAREAAAEELAVAEYDRNRGSGGKIVNFSNGPYSTSECSKLLY